MNPLDGKSDWLRSGAAVYDTTNDCIGIVKMVQDVFGVLHVDADCPAPPSRVLLRPTSGFGSDPWWVLAANLTEADQDPRRG